MIVFLLGTFAAIFFKTCDTLGKILELQTVKKFYQGLDGKDESSAVMAIDVFFLLRKLRSQVTDLDV